MAPMLSLCSGTGRCTLYPETGGSIGSWSIGPQPLLRTATAVTAGPLGMGSFPLVPFSNRIADARFDWHGSPVRLTANLAPEPHAIHGTGWTRPWRVTAQTATSAALVHVHPGDADWPWPFTARQIITLGDRQLHLALAVRNDAAAPVPLGFGHHPYFDAAGASLQFAAAQVWLNGPDGLPAQPVVPTGRFDFSAGAAVSGCDLDHGYAGIGATARIAWQGRPLALDIRMSPGLAAAVVYIPAGADYFCFEPVPHIVNALNLPGHAPAMPLVLPGEVFTASITLAARPAISG